MRNKSIKVIFDTNVWISFLIGKSLLKVKKYISDGTIIIVISEQLLTENRTVTSRKKFKKYFPKKSVIELCELLEVISEKHETKPTHFVSKDPKENFLLDLIDVSKADYLITGDKDLLEHNPFKTAKILTPKEFDKELSEK